MKILSTISEPIKVFPNNENKVIDFFNIQAIHIHASKMYFDDLISKEDLDRVAVKYYYVINDLNNFCVLEEFLNCCHWTGYIDE
jgi:hypothetical protein